MDPINEKENWLNTRWRPVSGWIYLVICVFDFILFPIAWSIGLALMGHPVTQWDPLTLKGAGLFHMAFGALLGVTAWGRTQEKIACVSNRVVPHEQETKRLPKEYQPEI